MHAALFDRYGRVPSPGVLIQTTARGQGYNRQNPCGRCGGQGGSDAWKHTGWTCYQCGGSGRGAVEFVPLYTADKLAKLNAAADKRAAKKEATLLAKAAQEKAEADLKRAAFEDAHSTLLAWLRATVNRDDTGFLPDLLNKGERYASWSEAQVAALTKFHAAFTKREAENAATKHVGAIGDRLTVKGTVIRSTSFQRPDPVAYWLRQTVYVVTLRDDVGNVFVWKTPNYKVRLNKGSTTTVKGTVKAHDEWKGEAQNVLQRVVVVESVEQEEAA